MSYKVLYRKYRPDDFENVVGQEYTIGMLKNAISSGKNAHAYIFTGPRGTGKTSSAKIFAKALNCECSVDGSPCNQCKSCLEFKDSPDVIEIDAASNNGVDEIRELINNVKVVPSNSKYKVYIIDEVHMLTTQAFNALLLTLEEPPSHVVFILATTDIQNVPITILSRCQRFDFKPVNKNAIIHRLKYICDLESIRISNDALEEIAVISAGGMRDALGMLDQLSNSEEEISLESVSSYFGSVSPKKIGELIEAIAGNNVDTVVSVLGNIRETGTNYSVFVEKLIYELRRVGISIKSGRSNVNISFDTVYSLIFDLNECLCNININVDPYILIEIVLLKHTNFAGNNFNSHSVVLGNKNNLDESNLGNNNIGNDNKINKEVKITSNGLGNNNLSSGNNDKISKNIDNKDSKQKKEKKQVIHKTPFDIKIRINNVFAEAEKQCKIDLINSWQGFMDYLVNVDRSMISLLADVEILVASGKYALVSSRNDVTNTLINESIFKLEELYSVFSGNNYRFAALNQDLWKKEAANYTKNLKNKVKYNYVEENIDNIDVDIAEENSNVSGSIEDIASDIFGTFEVE